MIPPPIAIHEEYFHRPPWARDSLAYLAASLRQSSGFEIEIIDAKFEQLNFEQVLQRAIAFQPAVVGLTALTSEIKPAAYQAAILKDALPGLVTVVGGAHATAIPSATLREFPSFDIAVHGEGEITFRELCTALREGDDLDPILGLAFRRQGKVEVRPPRPRILDQDSIPLPAWDLLPPATEYWVQTERGCPFNCLFCMNHNGRVARKRSVDRIIAELEMLIDRYGAKRIRFGDELFTVDMARTHALMDRMIELGLQEKIVWDCQTHVRFVDYALLKKMKDAGCERVDMGVETGDEQTLQRLGKGTTREMIIAAADAAHQAELPFGCLLILGHPNESPKSLERSISLAVRLNPSVPYISVMQPYPGTEISRLAAAGQGGYRLLTCDWDEYSTKIGRVMEFAGMTASQIIRLQLKAYLRVFLQNRRYLDLLRFSREHWRQGLTVVWKMLSRRSRKSRFPLKPSDYDQRLAGGEPFDPLELVESREAWSKLQTAELARTRREAPELVRL
ncbi:MAG: radical SAM protein [Pirellulales bacterium]